MPWSVDDAPRKFIEGQLRAIVGLELQITRIEAKAKLSQNRPVGDIAGIVAGLSARGDDPMAAAVEHANADRVNGNPSASPPVPPASPRSAPPARPRVAPPTVSSVGPSRTTCSFG